MDGNFRAEDLALALKIPNNHPVCKTQGSLDRNRPDSQPVHIQDFQLDFSFALNYLTSSTICYVLEQNDKSIRLNLIRTRIENRFVLGANQNLPSQVPEKCHNQPRSRRF